jgi:serine protease Do
MTVMVMLAVVGGVFVASIVPPLTSAQAQELRLVPAPPAREAPTALPNVADLAEQAIPSVVRVISTRTVRNPHSEGFDLFDHPFFRRFRGEPFEDEAPGRERPESQESSTGSGFFFTTDGMILTNKHVVEGATQIRVETSDNDLLEAELVGVDPYLDVAVIRVKGGGEHPALHLGDSDRLRVGEWVIAIGNPIIYRNSVTVGVVSGKGRRLDPMDGNALETYIQTDAAINFGNSGGPLLNIRGEVVGINTAILRDNPNGNPFQRGLIEGIGFALPVSQVKAVLDQLATSGTVKRGYLGVSVAAVTDEMAEYYELGEARGALIQSVQPGLPADRAGVEEGDVIVEVDGKPVADNNELVLAVSGRRPGDSIELGILREDPPGSGNVERLSLEVVLGERRVGLEDRPSVPAPTEPEEPETASALGITVGELSERMRNALGDREIEGVVITDVEEGSAAAEADLMPGMILMSINGRPTPDLDAYREVVDSLEPGRMARVRVAMPTGDEAFLFFRVP